MLKDVPQLINNKMNISNDSFLSYQEVKETIDKFEKEEWPIYDGIDLDTYLNKVNNRIISICHDKNYVFPALFFPGNEDFEFKYFRVRPVDEIKCKTLRAEYSYPPVAFTKSLRANLHGYPVFYCSDHPTVALLEYIQRWDNDNYKNREYAISRWSIKPNTKFLFQPFIPEKYNAINEYGMFAEYDNDDVRKLKWASHLTDDVLDGLRLFRDYFSDLFLRDDKRSISSFLAHRFLYGNGHSIDMLIYPSTKAKFGINNFAFHPNFVDEKMQLDRIYRLTVNDISEKVNRKFEFNLTHVNEFAINHNSQIHWFPIEPNKAKFDEFIKLDFKENFKEL